MSKSATQPSVGRILHYHKAIGDHTMNVEDLNQPMTAQILVVHPNGTVNVNVIDHAGCHFFRRDVPIIADGEPNFVKDFLTWMPYQKSVAAGEQAPTQHA